jgi:hypothetical protein
VRTPPGGPARLREALLRAGLALASLGLGLLLLEGGARLLRGLRGPGKEAAETERYHEYDPLLGWRKVPGARVAYRRREYRTEVAINRLGLRDPERGYEAPPGVARVLALGDSFVEGYSVSLAETLTQKLEEGLRHAGCAVEVINGGTAAYSTDQELLFYRSEGVKYRPGLVLVFFHYNDVVYSDRQDYFGRPKPIFEMRTGGLVLHRYPVRRMPRARAAPAPQPPPEREDGGGSALRELVKERLWYGVPELHDRLARLGLWAPMPRLVPRTEFRVFEDRPQPVVEGAWHRVEAILSALSRETAERGARLALVHVPTRMEVDDRSWALTKRLYGLAEPPWDRHLVARRLAAIGARLALPVLDLTADLRRADRGLLGRTYFTHDVHWTPRGHAAAARATQAFLFREGIPCPRGRGPS